MTTRLHKVLMGSCLALGLGLAAPASSEELRIGYISPVTGIFAQVGKDMVDGFQMYLDEHGGKLGGMDVKFIVEDDQGKPDAGVTKAKKLILQDKVHMFIGGLLASTGYALAPISTQEKTLYISSVSSADDLTQRQLSKYPYFVRTSWTSSLPHQPLGQWACDNGFKKVIVIAADYAFGYETAGGFQKVFEDCGGKVVQKIWPPLGTKDFGPYIPTIKADADAIFSLMVGPMSLQFPKQLAASGNKKPVIGGGTSYDEFVLPSMGDEVIGHVSALQYSAALETPQNEAFVKAYRKGVVNDEIMDIIRMNVRLPERAMGDLRAQIAAVKTGEKRFLEDRVSLATVSVGEWSVSTMYSWPSSIAVSAISRIGEPPSLQLECTWQSPRSASHSSRSAPRGPRDD